MVRFLARDVQSVTGRNLLYIQECAQVNPWNSNYFRVKDALVASELVEVPELDRWRIRYLCSLLNQRRDAKKFDLEAEVTLLESLISSLVKN